MKLIISIPFLFLLLLSLPPLAADIPRNALPVDAAVLPQDYRLHVVFSEPAEGEVKLTERFTVELGKGLSHDVAVEHPADGPPLLRVWQDGELVRGPEEVAELAPTGAEDYPDSGLDFGADLTVAVWFSALGGGTLFAMESEEAEGESGSMALFVRDGRLVYEVGMSGALTAAPRVNEGREHVAVLRQRDGHVELWLDGQRVADRADLIRPDVADHIFRVGRSASELADDFHNGLISAVRAWQRALPDDALPLLFEDGAIGAETPDFSHAATSGEGYPLIEPATGAEVVTAWVQRLERSDHGEVVRGWDAASLEQGREIYHAACVMCHGTKDEPGSLPTATRFHEGTFNNGFDPFSMFLTQTEGFNQMVAQPQFTTAQQYAVIQYIRETFLEPHNPDAYVEMTPEYIATLPKGLAHAEPEVVDRSLPPYELMELGPALFWTYEVNPDNIAQKGIAIRLDEGPGGVTKGRAWMVYDHDTMRVAAATSGDFVDWRGIAFDGSHGTHTSLTGERHWVNPVGPGWASPDGDWEDPRPLARDDRPYGPLPREWAQYRGLILHGDQVVIYAEIGGTPVLDSPGLIESGEELVFTRTINVGHAQQPLLLRVAPDDVNALIEGDGAVLRKSDGFWVAELSSGSKARIFVSSAAPDALEAIAQTDDKPLDLRPLTRGGPQQWPGEVVTTSVVDKSEGAFHVDSLPLPENNPWHGWMRPGGFDFTPDGDGAVVAMWNGDVWRVDGLHEPAPASLRWRRIATGLFQPLGVKFRGDDLFIICRDQLARLHDLNGNGEIDFIESFNNDHHVTEHFHEFAMGLQIDDEGNFYYAKSARHARDALVPHHGTLLRISADGERTDILATGFRAANGVCLNDDGSFFVTDQEGHWIPKNRINRVTPGGFYGNMMGYTDVTDESDEAMDEAMVWITNRKDRSPAELVWVPEDTWGPFGGSLLNLSYGNGYVFLVPHEEVDGEWQGAVGELFEPAFETGVMRGRFSDGGDLYAAGMYAWAGDATTPGGFYRIRYSGEPAHMPLEIRATKNGFTLTFSEPLDPESVTADAFKLTKWWVKRAARYGADHEDERTVDIAEASVSADGLQVSLNIPNMEPTQFYELEMNLRGANGSPVKHNFHGTVHALSEE